jgi:hypothetical protein
MIRMPLLWEDGWLASWLAFVQSVVSCPFAVLIIAAFFLWEDYCRFYGLMGPWPLVSVQRFSHSSSRFHFLA